jgi:hypothetical protein
LIFLRESQPAFSRSSHIHEDEVGEEGLDSLQGLNSVCRFVNGYPGERQLQTLSDGLSEKTVVFTIKILNLSISLGLEFEDTIPCRIKYINLSGVIPIHIGLLRR